MTGLAGIGSESPENVARILLFDTHFSYSASRTPLLPGSRES